MLLGPDLDLRSQYGTGSGTAKSMIIHADPNQQHCLVVPADHASHYLTESEKITSICRNTFLNKTSALWILYSARIILTFKQSDNVIRVKILTSYSVFPIRIWIGSGVNQVSGSGSGSRRAKLTNKNRKS
jgi:hypothetical protein